VLERIADGLGAPRAWLGLSYGELQSGSPSAAEQDVDEDMKRRALIAATSATVLGRVVQGLSELTEVALPVGQVLPSRLSMSHVQVVRAVTNRLRDEARYYGGQSDLFGAAATVYTPWLKVPATEVVRAALAAALAELHTEAGWCCYDSGRNGAGHFTRALRLAGRAGDAYGVANAAWHAGLTLVRIGHPNDALKLFQLGQIHLGGLVPGASTPSADDLRIPGLIARLSRQSATAYALMDRPNEATRQLAQVRDGYAAHDVFERGDAYLDTAVIQLDMHRLEVAEQFATAAARTYGEGHRRSRTMTELLIAEIHLRAGEPRGLTLAQHAIDTVSTLQSVVARRERLIPLAAALESRPGSDRRELARMAREVAAPWT
jgi:hypothetical protein